MRRRFNYTGRTRIARQDVLITLEEGERLTFDAVLDFDDFDLQPDANVVVEAYHQRFYKRFSFGTVADRHPPADRSLVEAEGLDHLKFRVKVVDTESRHGRILGIADRLTPESDTETEKKSILPVLWSEEIGNAVWRVDFKTQARPVLELNSLIDGIKETFLHEPEMKALILPEAVREVFYYMAFVEGTLASAPSDDWEGEWLQFIQRYHPVDPPSGNPSNAELKEWVDEAVDAFCDHFDPRGLIESR